MSPRSPAKLVDSFTTPTDILQEFADLTEKENVDPFAETQSRDVNHTVYGYGHTPYSEYMAFSHTVS